LGKQSNLGRPERVGKESERLREEGEGRRVKKWGVGRIPSLKRVDVKEGCGSEVLKEGKKEDKGKQEWAGCHLH